MTHGAHSCQRNRVWSLTNRTRVGYLTPWRVVMSLSYLHSDGTRRSLPKMGFTLVELLVVVAVIAVLVSLLVPAARAGAHEQ